MRCSIALLLLAAEMQIATSAILVETGQAAPVIDLRSIADNGRIWRFGISGWTASASWEKPADRGLSLLAGFSATPYNAHSSRRMYHDGRRARDLEFDSASYVARAGLRLRQNRWSSTEAAVVVGREVVDSSSLRDRWRRPYAGIQLTQRYRNVTADDPLAAQIHGFDAALTTEVDTGHGTWTRTMLSETAGRPLGSFHLQQSASVMVGSNLDTVSAFLVGGSWDVLGASAMYGTRYAQYRIERGAIGSAGIDYPLGGRWQIGARISGLEAPDVRAFGSMLEVTRHVAGIRLTIGGGRSGHTRSVFASVGGSTFRR